MSVDEAKANGYRPPLGGVWRRILNIVMVLSNCRQLDIATFCRTVRKGGYRHLISLNLKSWARLRV